LALRPARARVGRAPVGHGRLGPREPRRPGRGRLLRVRAGWRAAVPARHVRQPHRCRRDPKDDGRVSRILRAGTVRREALDRYREIIDRIEALARERGLSFDPVYFRLTDSDEIAEVASMGLPNRFIHWYWGGAYKELVVQQNKELFSILELVLNTKPSHAFLRRANTYLQNVLVIAHVFRHVDFFRHNHSFAKSKKKMLHEAARHQRCIR